MKIEEVPQDKGYLIEGRISDVNYAVDKDGHYTSVQSMGWYPKNEAMAMAWEDVFERAEAVRAKIIAGKLSPLAFYMEINLMDVSIVAAYTGISRWRVRRHLKMRAFKKLKPEVIAKYANAFNLTPDELVNNQKVKELRVFCCVRENES